MSPNTPILSTHSSVSKRLSTHLPPTSGKPSAGGTGAAAAAAVAAAVAWF
jgi:hypothetical protein